MRGFEVGRTGSGPAGAAASRRIRRRGAGRAGGRWRGRVVTALLGVTALAAGSLAAIGPAAANAPRLLDATPQLDLGFAAARLPVGAPGTLTFTVTDTAELAAKNGWSFTAQLPAGLVLDGASAATGCGSGTATVDAARGTVTVHGDLAAGQQACTATVRLTSVTGGTYQVCGSAITARVGVDLPGCASVTFDAPVFDARSHGVRLTSPLVGIGPLAASAHSCTSLPGRTVARYSARASAAWAPSAS